MRDLVEIKQKPSSGLAHIVDAYWIIDNPTPHDVNMPVLPDGCTDIIIKDRDIFVVGAMERAFVQTVASGDRFFGIRFKAGILGSLLGIDVSELNDKLLPLEPYDATLHRELLGLDTQNNTLFDTVNELLERRLRSVVLDERIMSATHQIALLEGNVSTEHLSHTVGLSQKQLGRLFRIHVGMTPKKYARIIRFIRTHKHLSREGMDGLCLRVLEKGYYDQAHFNREYKRLAGVNPTHEVMSIFYNTD
jgi:AraC-like DNA-binding protein